jgi:hypothetical protein
VVEGAGSRERRIGLRIFMDRVFEMSRWIVYVQSAAFARGVLEFIGCIGGWLIVEMFLKGPRNEHIHLFTTGHYTCTTALNVSRQIALVFTLTLMYTCIYRAKNCALFQIIGAF